MNRLHSDAKRLVSELALAQDKIEYITGQFVRKEISLDSYRFLLEDAYKKITDNVDICKSRLKETKKER